MIVPAAAVTESVDLVRAAGIQLKRRPDDIYDNSFVQNLDKAAF
jgi:hypothetical protein